ncbi:MAG: hypothetical protein E4H15_05685 [Syntrophobacterales bacterium]|nr:MAG: hypothetical protein E4H15_05685 [Syntrophobacterales bacterium]
MKRYLLAVIAVLGLLTGCATHFHAIRGDGVHLYLRAPSTGKVFFASSLDGYAPHPLTRNGEGVWETSVPAQREFRYFYIVDGKVFVPPCRLRERDDFGAENCVYCPDL